MSNISPMEQIRLVEAIAPTVLGSSQIGKYISLKNANRAYIVVHVKQLDANPITIYPYQATAVAGTSAKVFANVLPIWCSSTFSGSEAMTAETAAVNFSFGATTGDKCAIFEVQPGQMDLANGFDVLNVRCSVGTTDNIISALYWVDMRYQDVSTGISVFGN